MHILGGVSCGSYETMAIAFVDAGGHVTGRKVRWEKAVRQGAGVSLKSNSTAEGARMGCCVGQVCQRDSRGKVVIL